MIEKISYFTKNFWDYLNKNPEDSASLFSFTLGLYFIICVLRVDDIFLKEFALVMGIVFIINGYFTGLDIILRKTFNIKFLTTKVNSIVHISLIVILLQMLNNIEYNSIAYVFSNIIIIYFLRRIFYSFYIFSWRNNTKKSEENKSYDASSVSFWMIWFVLLIFSMIDFLYFKLLILFLVYGTYFLTRRKYLIKYIKSEMDDKTIYKRTIFTKVWNLNYMIMYSLVLIFLLFYYNLLTIFDTQSVLYFYSTTAQVFAALLGIIVMFSILILQKNDEKYSNRNRSLKKGLIGFTILYILVINFSIMGIVMNDIGYSSSINQLPENPNINDLKGLLSVSIFEFVILMIPVGMLYLYGMISDFLKWEATFEIKKGQSINSDHLKSIEGADKIVLKTTEP